MRGDALTERIKQEICSRIADGESLRNICLDDEMPGRTTVFKYLALDDDFANQYARARQEQADAIFDECLAIADQYDPTEKTAEGGTDHIQRAKLRIDTRKWMAGKLRPKKYGDKIAIGGDDEMDPIKTEETGAGAAKLAAFIGNLVERSG